MEGKELRLETDLNFAPSETLMHLEIALRFSPYDNEISSQARFTKSSHALITSYGYETRGLGG